MALHSMRVAADSTFQTGLMRTKKAGPSQTKLRLPRGIRLKFRPGRRCPWFVIWRTNGKEKAKAFESERDQRDYALDLAGRVAKSGVLAYDFNTDEVREWRAFRAQIGPDVTLEQVLAVWERSRRLEAGSTWTVADAVGRYLEAKEAEGMAKTTLDHYRPALARLVAAIGKERVAAVEREQIAEWISGLDMGDYSKRTHAIRARSLFEWLRIQRQIPANPCDGLKPVKIVLDEVMTWTVDEFRSLFENNESESPELLGRLALECFAGLRFSSAATITGEDIQFDQRGVVLPASKIKTRRRQFIDGLPDNLWHWLERSKPHEWSMTPRQYAHAKSLAVIRAGIRQIHNACRHGFGTYHMAAHKDAGKTAAILCHTNQAMLWRHYKGRATEADGASYLLIYPTGASCLLPSRSPAP